MPRRSEAQVNVKLFVDTKEAISKLDALNARAAKGGVSESNVQELTRNARQVSAEMQNLERQNHRAIQAEMRRLRDSERELQRTVKSATQALATVAKTDTATRRAVDAERKRLVREYESTHGKGASKNMPRGYFTSQARHNVVQAVTGIGADVTGMTKAVKRHLADMFDEGPLKNYKDRIDKANTSFRQSEHTVSRLQDNFKKLNAGMVKAASIADSFGKKIDQNFGVTRVRDIRSMFKALKTESSNALQSMRRDAMNNMALDTSDIEKVKATYSKLSNTIEKELSKKGITKSRKATLLNLRDQINNELSALAAKETGVRDTARKVAQAVEEKEVRDAAKRATTRRTMAGHGFLAQARAKTHDLSVQAHTGPLGAVDVVGAMKMRERLARRQARHERIVEGLLEKGDTDSILRAQKYQIMGTQYGNQINAIDTVMAAHRASMSRSELIGNPYSVNSIQDRTTARLRKLYDRGENMRHKMRNMLTRGLVISEDTFKSFESITRRMDALTQKIKRQAGEGKYSKEGLSHAQHWINRAGAFLGWSREHYSTIRDRNARNQPPTFMQSFGGRLGLGRSLGGGGGGKKGDVGGVGVGDDRGKGVRGGGGGGWRAYGNARINAFNQFNHRLTNVAQMAGMSLYGLGVVGFTTGLIRSTAGLASEAESMRNTLSGLVNTYGTFVDMQGKAVSRQQNFNRSLEYSRKLYQDIRAKAVRSILTTREMAEFFLGGAPQMMRQGMSDAQALDAVNKIGSIGKAMGLVTPAIMSDMRDLAQGQVTVRSQILRTLGFTSEGLRSASAKGPEALNAYIQERFEGFQPALDRLIDTSQAKFSIFVDMLQQLAILVGDEVLKPLIKALMDAQPVVEEWVASGKAQEFGRSLGAIAGSVVSAGTNILDFLATFATRFENIMIAGFIASLSLFVAKAAAQSALMSIVASGMSASVTAIGAVVAYLTVNIKKKLDDLEDAKKVSETEAEKLFKSRKEADPDKMDADSLKALSMYLAFQAKDWKAFGSDKEKAQARMFEYGMALGELTRVQQETEHVRILSDMADRIKKYYTFMNIDPDPNKSREAGQLFTEEVKKFKKYIADNDLEYLLTSLTGLKGDTDFLSILNKIALSINQQLTTDEFLRPILGDFSSTTLFSRPIESTYIHPQNKELVLKDRQMPTLDDEVQKLWSKKIRETAKANNQTYSEAARTLRDQIEAMRKPGYGNKQLELTAADLYRLDSARIQSLQSVIARRVSQTPEGFGGRANLFAQQYYLAQRDAYNQFQIAKEEAEGNGAKIALASQQYLDSMRLAKEALEDQLRALRESMIVQKEQLALDKDRLRLAKESLAVDKLKAEAEDYKSVNPEDLAGNIERIFKAYGATVNLIDREAALTQKSISNEIGALQRVADPISQIYEVFSDLKVEGFPPVEISIPSINGLQNTLDSLFRAFRIDVLDAAGKIELAAKELGKTFTEFLYESAGLPTADNSKWDVRRPFRVPNMPILGKGLTGEIITGIAKGVKHPGNRGACALVASQLIEAVYPHIDIPDANPKVWKGMGQAGAKALVDMMIYGGATPIAHPESAPPGSLIAIYGTNYGVIKDSTDRGWHVGMSVGDGKYIDDKTIRSNPRPIPKSGWGTVVTAYDLTTVRPGKQFNPAVGVKPPPPVVDKVAIERKKLQSKIAKVEEEERRKFEQARVLRQQIKEQYEATFLDRKGLFDLLSSHRVALAGTKQEDVAWLAYTQEFSLREFKLQKDLERQRAQQAQALGVLAMDLVAQGLPLAEVAKRLTEESDRQIGNLMKAYEALTETQERLAASTLAYSEIQERLNRTLSRSEALANSRYDKANALYGVVGSDRQKVSIEAKYREQGLLYDFALEDARKARDAEISAASAALAMGSISPQQFAVRVGAAQGPVTELLARKAATERRKLDEIATIDLADKVRESANALVTMKLEAENTRLEGKISDVVQGIGSKPTFEGPSTYYQNLAKSIGREDSMALAREMAQFDQATILAMGLAGVSPARIKAYMDSPEYAQKRRVREQSVRSAQLTANYAKAASLADMARKAMPSFEYSQAGGSFAGALMSDPLALFMGGRRSSALSGALSPFFERQNAQYAQMAQAAYLGFGNKLNYDQLKSMGYGITGFGVLVDRKGNPTTQRRIAMKNLGNLAMQYGGNLMGTYLGQAVGGEEASVGLGTQLGGILGPSLFAGLGAYGGPVGMVVGGIIGGLFGRRSRQPDPLEEAHKRKMEELLSSIDRSLRPVGDYYNSVKGEALFGAASRYLSGRFGGSLGADAGLGSRLG